MRRALGLSRQKRHGPRSELASGQGAVGSGHIRAHHGTVQRGSHVKAPSVVLGNPEEQRDSFTKRHRVPKQYPAPLVWPQNTLLGLFSCVWFPLVRLDRIHSPSHVAISVKWPRHTVGSLWEST